VKIGRCALTNDQKRTICLFKKITLQNNAAGHLTDKIVFSNTTQDQGIEKC